jgi:peptidoglycan/xylan/chitin deacetylase (PgdA/CDA1 family)
VVGVPEVLAAAQGRAALPERACLLTFDDGLLDHFTVVFPRLLRRRLTAGFYPPAAPVLERRMLDVHKIHAILAATTDAAALARRVRELIDQARGRWDLPPSEALYRQHAEASRFDPAEIVFVKRVLQKGLPAAARAALVDALLAEVVGVPEPVLAQEWYLDLAQLQAMADAGMAIGGHGAEHVWLDTLPRHAQAEELRRTRDFLARVHGGRAPADWALCYPYGAYDGHTLALLREAGGALGLTTRVAVADLAAPLELARLDTNDLPVRGDAAPADWTRAVLATA